MKTTKAIGRSFTERLCIGLRVSALVALIVAFFYCGEVFAIEFLTRDDFNARKSAYSDYPVNILFKKLPESNAQETREIRNLIILHQVFDTSMQDMEKTGLIQYQKYFGVIKRISGDSMEFWDAETDTILEFHVGIDLIPMENTKGYKVTKSGISKYAAIVYILDTRLYKVEIRFRPVEPTNLRVERGTDGTNIVSWIKPPTDEIPQGYTLYVNGKPTQTVTSTSARVPLKKGRVDRYYVRAIYKHCKKTISSVPSEEVADEITAGEIEKMAYANREFDQVLSGLTPSRWEDSRDLLYDNEQLFFEHLEGDSKTHAMALISFFRDIDAGDRLIEKTDIQKRDIDAAEKKHLNAEKKAKRLPASMAVMFLVRIKTHAVSEKRAAIERDRQMQLAEQGLDKILADLTPSGWETARKQLYRNETLFKENLEGQRKTDALNLIQFFRDIEEGDRILGRKGATRQDVDIASEMFNRASEVAKLLPASVNVQFILTARTREISERKSRLKRQQQMRLAESRFEDVISGLTVSNWEASRETLYANENLFSEHLVGNRQRDARRLVEFFRSIDEGDQIAQKTDATLQELDGATGLYDNASETAKQLSPGIEVQFIVILKKSAVALKREGLQRQQRMLKANQSYDKAVADPTPDTWRQSRDQLYANEAMLY